jgi:F420-non-reducing hydrogenase small subunit
MPKPKLALYWAASCGGCEIAILDLHEKVLEIDANFELVFWPVAMDAKYSDLEAMPAGSIDLCLFNGSIRSSENEHVARLLRDRAKTLVAFGSCAHEGCIPGLANAVSKREIFQFSYHDAPSMEPGNGTEPQTRFTLPEGEVELPELYEQVKTLDQVVQVDYTIPGCPPQAHQIWAVIELILSGMPLPPVGSVIGAGQETCCEECSRTREEKRIRGFVRPHQVIADPEQCLLDQGILCLGPATRSGCGGLCVEAGVPCRGCYGPPPNVRDQGAKMISALASVIDATDADEIQSILDQLDDPLGTLYRFSLASSTLGRAGGPDGPEPEPTTEQEPRTESGEPEPVPS